jgi:EpsD family peptidyl-prolyl cis-trans isomerase
MEVRSAIALMFVCGLVLSGCGKKEDQGAASNGQIVARVGNEDVTTQELENEFRLNNIPPDKQKDPAIVKQILSELVVRKYLLQQAVTAKLDREPGVLLDLLRARAQVLANAFLVRTVANEPISKADIDNYIANNPSKFANRQLLTVEQIAFPLAANTQSVVDATKESKSLDEVDQQLTSMGVQHGRSMGALTSSEIPTDLFNAMQTKKADDVFFARSGANGVFFQVRGQEARPLAGEAAASLARQLIRSDKLKAQIGMASVAANLEAKYQGDYATIMGGGKN